MGFKFKLGTAYSCEGVICTALGTHLGVASVCEAALNVTCSILRRKSSSAPFFLSAGLFPLLVDALRTHASYSVHIARCTLRALTLLMRFDHARAAARSNSKILAAVIEALQSQMHDTTANALACRSMAMIVAPQGRQRCAVLTEDCASVNIACDNLISFGGISVLVLALRAHAEDATAVTSACDVLSALIDPCRSSNSRICVALEIAAAGGITTLLGSLNYGLTKAENLRITSKEDQVQAWICVIAVMTGLLKVAAIEQAHNETEPPHRSYLVDVFVSLRVTSSLAKNRSDFASSTRLADSLDRAVIAALDAVATGGRQLLESLAAEGAVPLITTALHTSVERSSMLSAANIMHRIYTMAPDSLKHDHEVSLFESAYAAFCAFRHDGTLCEILCLAMLARFRSTAVKGRLMESKVALLARGASEEISAVTSTHAPESGAGLALHALSAEIGVPSNPRSLLSTSTLDFDAARAIIAGLISNDNVSAERSTLAVRDIIQRLLLALPPLSNLQTTLSLPSPAPTVPTFTALLAAGVIPYLFHAGEQVRCKTSAAAVCIGSAVSDALRHLVVYCNFHLGFKNAAQIASVALASLRSSKNGAVNGAMDAFLAVKELASVKAVVHVLVSSRLTEALGDMGLNSDGSAAASCCC